MTKSTEQERADFEAAWMESTGTYSPPKRSSNGDYVYPGAYNAWKWWQAARRAPAATVPQETCVICGSDAPYTGTCGSNDPRALCKKPAPQPPEAAQLDEIEPVWNAQVDEFNQRAAAYAVAKLATKPSENLQPNPEKIFSQPNHSEKEPSPWQTSTQPPAAISSLSRTLMLP